MTVRLERAPWLGNVRELRNALERAMILAEGQVLKAEHLWIEPPRSAATSTSASGSLADVERETILGVLTR